MVKQGDTLWQIAKKMTGDGENYKAIASKNNIKNPDKISVGQKLVI
ncbi:MAG: LysM peptidoglycan-binding domain-containing protein [Cellulosilyticaceae bacterium]